MGKWLNTVPLGEKSFVSAPDEFRENCWLFLISYFFSWPHGVHVFPYSVPFSTLALEFHDLNRRRRATMQSAFSFYGQLQE